MLQHSAILSTFIKLPFVIKIFALSIFEWPFYTDFTTYTVKSGLDEDSCKYVSFYDRLDSNTCMHKTDFKYIQ